MPSEDLLERAGARSSAAVSRRRAIVLGGTLLASSMAGCLDQVEDTADADDDPSDEAPPDEADADPEDDDGDQSGDDDSTGEDDDDSESNDEETDDDDSNGGDSNDEDSDDEDTDLDDDAPEELIEAGETLLTNAYALDAYASEESDPTTQSLSTIDDRLDTTESLLEPLDETADATHQTKIEQYGSVVDLQRKLVTYYSLSLAFDEAFESALDSWEAGEFQTAIEFLDDASNHTDDARSTVESLEGIHETLKTQYLEAALAYSGSIWDHLPAAGWNHFDATTSLVSGLQLHLETLGTLVDGEHAYLNADFATAEARFETALASAHQVLSIFEDLVDSESTPSDVLTLAIQFRADLGSTIDALQLFVDAAVTAQEGNQEEADSMYEDAVETLPE